MNEDNDEDGVKKHRRTYGRGYIDGLQAAGLSEQEASEFMNNAKLQATVLGQTGIARKVYAIVPQDESWPATKIISEMRKHGHNVEFNVLEGCLSALKAAKLVKEDKHGWYRPPTRHLVKAADPPGEPAKLVSVPVALPQEAPRPAEDVLSRVGGIAAQLRKTAAELEDLALEIEQKAQQVNKDSEKLKKLREFLDEQ